MIELIQFPWSPFCLVQRRILEFSGVRFKITNLKLTGDRSPVWKLTKERYYAVPVIRDGRNVVFETGEESQVIGKYLDQKLKLGLFPAELEGEQAILWRYIENEIEGLTFRLNDAYFRENVSKPDQLAYIRHKERKFGRGCLDQWRTGHKQLQAQLAERLLPFEQMLGHRPFLLGARPRFVDFDLLGMLDNFLYSGRYRLPARHSQIRHWVPPAGIRQAFSIRNVKNYILDTNVLLHDPNSLLNFQDNNVLIPIEVIEEIDRFKRESTELGQNARTVSRMLDGFRGEGSLSAGVKLPTGGKLRIPVRKRA